MMKLRPSAVGVRVSVYVRVGSAPRGNTMRGTVYGSSRSAHPSIPRATERSARARRRLAVCIAGAVRAPVGVDMRSPPPCQQAIQESTSKGALDQLLLLRCNHLDRRFVPLEPLEEPETCPPGQLHRNGSQVTS